MYGVAVHDNDVATGTIVKSEFGTFAKMEKECTGGVDHSRVWGGCAKAAGIDPPTWPSPTHEYEIYYADHKCVPYHEACHSRFEQKSHTVKFNLAAMQGDTLAACP